MGPVELVPDRERAGRILTLALPIVGSMVSQNVLNLVDTAMVGSLGDAALAAVGLGGFVTFLSQSIILGLSAGVQAVAARRRGEGRVEVMAESLNGGLLLSLALGLPLSLVLWWAAPAIYGALNADPEVLAHGVPYYRWRLVGVVFTGMNFSFRGYWNGVGLSQMYLRTILVMHVTNIVVSYWLIFGGFGVPALGTTGASIGTTVSVMVGTAVYFSLARLHAAEAGFLARIPGREELGTLLRLSIPNGIQQLFFSAGLTALYWIVGKVGTPELAAANVLINLNLVAILPAMGLGLAAASLVGQALGRKEPEDAARWGWNVVGVGLMVLVSLGLPYLVVPDPILGIFLREQATLELARNPLRLAGATMVVEAFGMILMNALLGAGDTKTAMAVSIVAQWFVFLPIAWLVGPGSGGGLMAIWWAQAGYRALLAVTFTALWHRGRWASIKV